MTSQVQGYLTDLERELHLPSASEREILHEIRSHIEESADERMRAGASSDDALAQALDGLGAPTAVARKLYEVHTQGTWYQTALAVTPHVLLSLMFALGLWTTPGWPVGLLIAIITIGVFGWRMGRPNWAYPWLGYCLVAPIVSWGLAMSAVGYGAWGVIARGTLPLGVPIYAASFVYIAGSLWIVIRVLTKYVQRDWVIASLTVLPVPFLTYWFFYFYSGDGRAALGPGVEASAAVVFLLLAGATALFFRIGRRLVRIALLAITAPSTVVLAWLSYQGGPGFMAMFTLSALLLVVLLAPALFAPRRPHHVSSSTGAG